MRTRKTSARVSGFGEQLVLLEGLPAFDVLPATPAVWPLGKRGGDWAAAGAARAEPETYRALRMLLLAKPVHHSGGSSSSGGADTGGWLAPSKVQHVYGCLRCTGRISVGFAHAVAALLRADETAVLVVDGDADPAWRDAALPLLRALLPRAWGRVLRVPAAAAASAWRLAAAHAAGSAPSDVADSGHDGSSGDSGRIAAARARGFAQLRALVGVVDVWLEPPDLSAHGAALQVRSATRDLLALSRFSTYSRLTPSSFPLSLLYL